MLVSAFWQLLRDPLFWGKRGKDEKLYARQTRVLVHLLTADIEIACWKYYHLFINSSVSNLPVYIVANCPYAVVTASVLTALSFALLPWHLPQVLPCIISLDFCMEARWNMTAAPVVVLATIWKVCSAWHLS